MAREAIAPLQSTPLEFPNVSVVAETKDGRILLMSDSLLDCFGPCETVTDWTDGDAHDLDRRIQATLKEPHGFLEDVANIRASRAPRTDVLGLRDGRLVARTYAPLAHPDGAARHVWTYRNVTQQVEATSTASQHHEFYQQVLRALPAQLAVFSRDLIYEYVTPSAFRDPETRQWVIGKSEREYCARRNLPAEVTARREEALNRVVQSGTEVEFEESFNARTGELRHFRRFCSPVLDAHGRVQHVLGYGMDITDLKRVEADLRHAKQEAEKLGQAKERFLANMSHELRTPLNAVVGTSFLLESSALDAEQREYVATIRSSADTLLSLINDILDFTKIGTGAVTFEKVPFDVKAIIAATPNATKATALAKGLRVRGVTEVDVPDRLEGDPTRLKQILINLVGNAVKFTSVGEVRLEVRLAADEGASTWLEFEVSDSGIGISPSKIEQIFEAFTQERDDTTRLFGGSGLGLAIVHDLVTQQGGTIRVTSSQDTGSRFTVRLPFAAVSAEANPTPEGASSVARLRVLLVEDNSVNQWVAMKLLERAGAIVVVEGNGLAAVDRLRADRRFDVVLMDIQMPSMDGFEASRRIRTELGIASAVLPILALTASAVVEQRERALEAGMNDFVMKPFNPDDLFRLIRHHVDRARAQLTGLTASPCRLAS